MSRELLAALDQDAERLLFAGAQVARGDNDLSAHKNPLAPLAARAPAIARVVEQVEKVQQATGRPAAVELLNLSALMAQVRGAQAAPAPSAGELAPLPATVPLESPLHPTELTTLYNALTNAEGSSHRPRILEEAAERGAVRDVRLLSLCLSALGDPAIADVVERKLLPALGEAVAPELLASLNLQSGKAIDARKLRALAAIRKAAAKPLIHQALEQGSSEIRTAAIAALGMIDPVEAEPIALRMLTSERSLERRLAALEALGICAGDSALDALLAAFANPPQDALRDAARDALARSPHPRATERLLTLLTPELLALAPLEEPKGRASKQKEAAQKAWEEHQARGEYLETLVDLLGRRRDQQAVPALIGVLRNHKLAGIREAAAGALVESGDPEAFSAILSGLKHKKLEGSFLEDFTWNDSQKAFELVVRMAAEKIEPGLAWRMLQILTSRPDPRVPPLLPGFLDACENEWGRRQLFKAIRDAGDASLAAPLQSWLTKSKNGKRLAKPERAELEELIASFSPT